MQTTIQTNFNSVKTEGAILPAELLQRVTAGHGRGLRPEDYHLAPTERLNEAINRSWTRLLGVWQSFDTQRHDLSPTISPTSFTRDKWLLILFQELGYGRVPYVGGIEIPAPLDPENSLKYPVSHLWRQTPIHMVAFLQELDKRDSRICRSPHSLMQEFLNRSDAHLWGIVTNGLQLRLLRNNKSFTRAAYLEFDLEAMLVGEQYADFSLLWLMAHESRLDPNPTGDSESESIPCWLEQWSQEAAEQGTRALDSLRDGVQETITLLGRGFLAHPANRALRDDLRHGRVSTQDYYRQLLRLVYRLIFLFVAEERDLLLTPPTAETIPHYQTLYRDHYALSRLRELALARRGGPHPDLYRTLQRLMVLLQDGYAPLGLPSLGSFLFSPRATPDLDRADLGNHDLLEAIRALAFTTERNVRRSVDYKNLGAEELGSVYESLLELHPRMDVGAYRFDLHTAAGSERKTTGSYYTPTALITELLDTALEPVVAERLKGVEGAEAQVETLLSIRVVDPACGSGHFLLAAAQRLALHLARVRTGDDEPSPEARRDAVRDVVRHCIYGVDINEMSVELCKVALWMETLTPGKPLSFLDSNIQCGNSLLGTTPALLDEGVPDEAFKPILGDDKAYCREWRNQNKKQKESGQLLTMDNQPWYRLGNFAAELLALGRREAQTAAEVRQQEEAYIRLLGSSDYLDNRLLADAWCAAFVWDKRPEHMGGYPFPITTNILREIAYSPHNATHWMKAEVQRLSQQYQFFHWHLAFPQVFLGEVGEGFDVVLGNPPWERIKIQEKEWFAVREPEIANARNAAARRKLIRQLPQENPELYQAFMVDKRKAEGESHFVRDSGKYPLCGRGDVNTYTIFAELSRHLISGTGRAGVIVPSGIATDDTTKFFFQDIMEQGSLVSLHSFENEALVFPAVHHATKFCLLTLSGLSEKIESANFVFFARRAEDLRERDRRFSLTADEIALLNPNTRTCPIFRTRRDAELTKGIYRRVPVLIREDMEIGEVNPWGIRFFTMFHMSSDSGLFRTREQLAGEGFALVDNRFVRGEEVYLPLYEGKIIHHFDHRFGSYNGQTEAQGNQGKLPELTPEQHGDPFLLVLPRYWVRQEEVSARLGGEQWFIGFRNVARSTDERTAIITIVPVTAIGHSLNIALSALLEAKFLAASLTTFAFDFVTRQKVGGINFSFYIIKQLPVLPPEAYQQPCPWQPNLPLAQWLLPRILELTYTAHDLAPFARDCGYHGPPFRWDEERRFLLRCELDAAYFHLYGIGRDDVAYIMDTFPIVKRKDEAAHGEYRTKRVILEIYDEMARAIGQSSAYQTRLDPPPAHHAAAHPWDEAHLGPEQPVAAWWAQSADEAAPAPLREPSPVYKVNAKAGAEAERPPLTLTPPPAPAPAAKPASASPPPPPLLIPLAGTFPVNTAPRPVRLKRAMKLAQPQDEQEWRELVGFLGDEDGNIRWMASSALARQGNTAVVQLLSAFVQVVEPARLAVARPEVVKVLGMLAETGEDEVRAAAASLLASLS